jgi:hypothetical protein
MNPKVTLDTNCFFDYFGRGRLPQDVRRNTTMRALVQWGLDGRIDLAMTTRVMSDTIGQSKTGKSDIWEDICNLPIVKTIGTVFRFDCSGLGSASGDSASTDFLVSVNDSDTEKRLKKIMQGAKQNDIDHLLGHRNGNRDIFVTSDSHFLDHADALKREFGTVVMNPESAVIKIAAMLKVSMHNQTDPE